MKNVEDVYPLSPMQAGMMFHTLFSPGSGAYVVHISSRIEGDFNIPAFQHAWQKLLERHPVLRSAFLWDKVEKPLQVVRTELVLEWDEQDWRGLIKEQQEQRLREYLWEEHHRGFDLAQAPLMRMALVRLGEHKYQFIWNYSHLLLDGWSVNIIFSELFAYYRAFAQGHKFNMPRPRPYRDFIAWMQAQNKTEAEAFWRKTLKGFTAPTTLGVEELKSSEHGHEETEQFELSIALDRETTARLQSVARQHRITLSTVQQGVWARLLSCYSGTDDLVFGVTVTGRPVSLRGVESVVGLLVNTLPMRVKVRPEQPVMGWLKEIQEQQVEIRKYESSSLVEVRSWSEVPATLPLFESFVVFENHPVATGVQELHGNVRFTSGRSFENATYPLVYLTEPGDQLPVRIMFDRSRFGAAAVRRILGHIQQLLVSIAEAPEQTVGELFPLTAQERQHILVDWNRTQKPLAVESTIHQRFEEQAARTPQALAVIYEDRQLTYEQLNRRANQLARYLRRAGIQPEIPVGVCLERSVDLVVALLAVLKSGGAYVPLDPNYPRTRLETMLEDVHVPVLLTQGKLRGLLQHSKARLVCLDDTPEIAQENEADLEHASAPDNLAYVIFTSGSTGKPKGTAIAHRSVLNLEGTLQERIHGRHAARTRTASLNAPVIFDASVQQLLLLLRGYTLVIVPESVRRDGKEFVSFIRKHDLDVLDCTPSHMEALTSNGLLELPSLSTTFLVGGEAISGALWQKLRDAGSGNFYNVYGPTECTVDVAAARISGAAAPPVIGRPLANTRFYVLDRAMQPVPTGVAGELHIAGSGLARGYFNYPELTAEKFIPDLFSQAGGERLYRTGDLVRWREDGNLEFLGRIDQQVKIRGHRIELGEIEAVLAGYEGVEQAVVVAREEQAGEKQLVGYVAAREKEAALSDGALRSYLKERLPEYMVPSAYVVLDGLPMTPSGKVDRRALPAPERLRKKYRAPQTPQEEMLCAIFAEVLGLERAGVDDNFFDLGGHSLLAMRLVSRVRATLGVELALRTLFEFPTPVELAPQLHSLEKARNPLARKQRPERLPLSYAQMRLWFLDQLEGSSTEYNIPEALRLRGELDHAAVQGAINAIIERHEVLRTHFAEVDGGPVQVIVPELHLTVPVEDLSAATETARRERIEQALRQEYETPFDLSRGPLLRLRLFKMAEQEHVLLLNSHHIISDAWSQDIFNQEFITLYESLREGRQDPLRPLPLQYADFALWQREWLDEITISRDLEYWKQQLAGIPEQLELPTDHPRGARRTFAADVCNFILPARQLGRLKRSSHDQRATLFMALLAGFAVLLERYSGQQDIVVGSPIANRQEPQLEQLIGFFVNSLVLRTEVRPEGNFRELLAAVRGASFEAYKHQDLPFERLVEELAPQRNLSAPPIFQVTFALQNAPVRQQGLKGLEIEPLSANETRVRFDLEVHAWERNGELQLDWVYNRDLFDRWRVEQMARHYGRLLEAFIASPDVPLQRLELLSDEERRTLLEDFNPTGRPLPLASVPKLFEQQAALTPTATAVVDGDRSFSYAELNTEANRLAHHLMNLGVGPEIFVGVAMERSLETIVVLLGILKAGGAYLSLARNLPAARRNSMMATAKLQHVVTTEKQRGLFGPLVRHVVTLEAIAQAADAPPDNPAITLSPLAPTHVNYTSGSTGQPKGVVITHEGVARLVWQPNFVTLDASTRMLHVAPLSFDSTTFEIWGALLNGGTLIVLAAEVPSMEEIGAALVRHEVNTMWLTAGLFHEFVDSALGALAGVQQLLAGGDVLSVDHVQRVLQAHPQCRVINGYGPTESTTFTSCYPVSAQTDLRLGVPIGFPLWNTRVYVLDAHLKPVPVGVTGELYVAGEGLARSYLNEPGLTAEKFIPDPHARQAGARMYRTGDLARWNPEGALQFLGRADQQIKIRGFRIEPAEIEAALLQIEGVHQCAVVARGKSAGEKSLAAYVVPQPEAVFDPAVLRQLLGEHLPDYMIPAAFVMLDALPLTTTGKLDRRALPEPVRGQEGSYRAARTPVEEMLCEAFAQVLEVERIGIDDDFFAQGGHSLMATRLASRIRAMLGVELPLRTLFEFPTVAGVALQLNQARSARVPLTRQARPERIPLSYAQQRLWFIDQLQKSSSEYNLPEALRLRGPLSYQALERTVQAIVERHEVLRTRFAEIDGLAIQIIEPHLQVPMPVEDLSTLDATSQSQRVIEALRQEQERPFDLASGPLLRMKLLKLGKQEHVLLRTFHHIVSDAWSHGVFNREFMLLYEAFCDGRQDPLPALPVQYADFALWQRDWLNEETISRELEYWKKHLAGIPEQLGLPTDRPRPSRQTFAADVCTFTLPAAELGTLKALVQAHHATLYIGLLAAFAVLLERHSGQRDVVVGSPIANRQEAQLEQLIGFFVNSLVMRVKTNLEAGFSELIAAVRTTALEAYQHQDLPFERLVEELSPQRSLNTPPIFQVMFAMQNAPFGLQRLKGLEIEPVKGEELRLHFDLEMHAWEHQGELHFFWVYNRDLFDHWRMERMAHHYGRLLRAVMADSVCPLWQIDLLSAEERHQLLVELNPVKQEITPQCIHELFEQQVERTPAATALMDATEELSYSELNRRSNCLAWYLRKLGVGPEVRVGVCMERGAHMVMALLAVLKAGGAYTPLDPNYPAERVRYTLEDAKAPVLLTQQKFSLQLPPYSGMVVMMDEQWEEIARENAQNPGRVTLPENLSHLIYTSGSTGRPKGIAIRHSSAAVMLHWAHQVFSRQELSVVLAATSICFDISVFEIFAPLTSGGSVLVAESALAFPMLEKASQVTLVDVVPSAIRELARSKAIPDSVMTINLPGEALSTELVRDVFAASKAGKIFNLYGPSEDTTFSTWALLRRDLTAVTIGRPLTNTRIYLLDEWMQPVPFGVAGEIYLGGDGLARGYLDRSDMTAERFVPDPLSNLQGERLYRTGDLARYLKDGDGNLEFLGRADQQVKIRGFRIEPGEIEVALSQHASVAQAVVVPREDRSGNKKLVAYMVAQEGHTLDYDELRRHLRQGLPEYMVPAVFMALAALPLTPNGKLDRKALPPPEGEQVSDRYVSPRTELEQTIARVWQEVLEVEKIGVHDNFFDRGGHSLLARLLQAKLCEALGCEIELVDLFQYPTIAAFAQFIESGHQAAEEPRGGEERVMQQKKAVEKLKRARSV